MRRLLILLAAVTLSASANAEICHITVAADFYTALDDQTKCQAADAKGMRYIQIDAPLSLTAPVTIPDNTIVFGANVGHPFTPVLLTDAIPKNTTTDCFITMGKNTSLANFSIALSIPKNTSNAICIDGTAYVMRVTIDTPPSIAGYYNTGINVKGSTAFLIENIINVGLTGINALKPAAIVRNKIATGPFENASGIIFGSLPIMTLGNELVGTGKIHFPSDEKSKFPLGVAANILKLNTVPSSNFHDIYKILPSGLINCNVPIGYNPYKADGSCLSYTFNNETPVATCPVNQIKKADNSCGCPDLMTLDPTSGLCFVEKVIEKPVEVIIEKPVEVVIEKPVPGESVTLPGEFNPIIANPSSGGGSCSLVPDQVISALTPISVFLITIGLTGFAAYRSSVKPQRVRGKTKE